MAKAPIPGTVKTRLRLPPEEAAGLAAALLTDAVEKARRSGPVTVASAPADGRALVEPLLPEAACLIPQIKGDLGERIFAAALLLFEENPAPVLILGTDAPTLPPESIERAARALEEGHDASIVGSTDGGYVLPGLRELHKALFHDIDWSTEAVYRQTLEKARRVGLSVHEGQPHYDVDTPEDLARLEKELRRAPDLAPHTAEFLRSSR